LNDKEGDHPFVECATWPDDIRMGRFHYTAGWHFIDTPLYADGLDAEKVGFKPDLKNVSWALDQMLAVLQDPFSKQTKDHTV